MAAPSSLGGARSARVALVTGAASGIGLATAERLLQRGFRTVLLGRSSSVEAAADHLAPRHPGAVRAIVCDVTVEAQVQRAVAEVESAWDGCDVLVNNAGIHPNRDGRRLALAESTLADWQAVLDVNLTAPFLLMRAVLPGMRRRRWGRIVNVGSSGGRGAARAVSAQYAASKAGLIGLTRAAALEAAADGVLVNCVAPGPTLTTMSSALSEAVRRELAAGVPLGRFGRADEVATVIAFLAGEDASFLTGAVIDVNGGVYMP